MIALGKRLFDSNPVQFLCIIVAASLIVVAQKFAIDLSDMSLSMFISGELNTIFTDRSSYHLLLYVIFPSIIYLAGGFLFLWMGIINVVMAGEEESKIGQALKVLIALFQLSLFTAVLLVGGKLFLYSTMFLLIMFVTVALLVRIMKGEGTDA